MENRILHILGRYVFDHAGFLCLVLDREGVVVESNCYARETIGIDPVGKPFASLLVDFSGEFDLSNALTGREEQLLHVTTADGSPQSYSFTFLEEEARPAQGAGPAQEPRLEQEARPAQDRLILVCGETNYRETVMLQQNLLELNRQFSNMSRELQKKTAELEKLNRLKNEFIGTAAHDLRNPIGAIKNLSSVLLEDPEGSLKPEHGEVLTMIKSSSEFILSLLDDLLSIAKIEAGKLNLDIKPDDLVDFVTQNIRINRIFADKKNIGINLNLLEGCPPVPFDRLKMEQVMNNLLSNAIKYSPAGAAIEVSLFLSGDHATVSVRDRGPGIPPKERDKLFKAFSRTSVRAPAGESSTGLGLAIARNIVVGHLGEIGMKSAEGGGSLFYFSLPLVSHVRDAGEESR